MSSFRKRLVKHPVPGTRSSPQTGQLITSTGNPSLDVILGGGLPIGSLCLIEEDKFVTYSKVLAKYFMAEGVLSNQSIFLGSLDDSPKELIRKLPQQCTATNDEENAEISKNGLRIAWRYDDLPIVNSEQTTEAIGHNFNLMEFMEPIVLKQAHTILWCDEILDNDIVVDGDDDDDACNMEHSTNDDVAKDSDVERDSAREKALENSKRNATPNPALCRWDLNDSVDDLYDGNDDNVNMIFSKKIALEDSKMSSKPNPAASSVDKQSEPEDNNATVSDTSATISVPSPPSTFCKELQLFTNPKYFRLIKELQNLLSDGFLVKRSLCRVCITSLGSPQWYDENFVEDLMKFLTMLRALVRSSVSVCFITMPMHLVANYDDTLVYKIRTLVDYAIGLQAFAGSENEIGSAFKEYNGLFKLHKMTAVNTLSAYLPETTDLAFKLKRKKFVIEKLHLPPEVEDNSRAKQEAHSTVGCGSSENSDLNKSCDF